VVAFMFLSRLHGSSPSGAATTAPSATTPVPPASGSTALPAAPVSPVAPSGSPGTLSPGSQTSDFQAGAGLPAPVVKAYDAGDVVVLLVTKQGSLDQRRLRVAVHTLNGHPGLAVFVTNAAHVSDYSRIAEGVNVNQAPALVVLEP